MKYNKSLTLVVLFTMISGCSFTQEDKTVARLSSNGKLMYSTAEGDKYEEAEKDADEQEPSEPEILNPMSLREMPVREMELREMSDREMPLREMSDREMKLRDN